MKFSKAAMLTHLDSLAYRIKMYHNIDANNGTAQLWPRGCNQETKNLIDRAVEYGRYRALTDMEEAVRNNEVQQ